MSNRYDEIFGSVAEDFFGSSDDAYKNLIQGGSLEQLEAMQRKIFGEGSAGADNAAETSPEIREATELLAKMDEILLRGMEAQRGDDPQANAAALENGESGDKGAVLQENAAEVKPQEPERSGREELEELIGLDNIKHDVKELVSFLKIQKIRESRGNRTVPVSLHLVFTGNPGTGKTTIARILAKLYKEIGVLSKGQLVEVDRSGLVAGYVGQTAVKTQEKIQEALGGILFVDEAYSLAKDGNDFGQEAIDTLLKAMEDHRSDFVVIVAGYTDRMEAFIGSNPGLKSRFNKYIEFPDYSAEELYEIFLLSCRKYGYTLSGAADKALRDILQSRVEHKGDNFANAREARNLFEAVVTNQATRIAAMEEDPAIEDVAEVIDDEALSRIEAEDLGEFML